MSTDQSQEQLLQKAGQLTEWIRSDRYARQAVMSALASRGHKSLGEFASKEPEAFLELHDAVETMREELPWT